MPGQHCTLSGCREGTNGRGYFLVLVFPSPTCPVSVDISAPISVEKFLLQLERKDICNNLKNVKALLSILKAPG